MGVSPTVSVVIPVRDGERYLSEAIGSVLEQRPAPHEIVVVDDGSRDGSARIAAAFGPPVIVLRRSPGGSAPAARNAGLAAATGDVLGFLDADDTWRPGRLVAQLGALEDADLVFGHVDEQLSPELTEAERAALPRPRGVVPGRVVTALLARRTAFDRVGRFDETLAAADFLDWLARARALGLTETMLDRVVADRRIHTRNTTWVSREADVLRALRTSLRRGREAQEG